MLFHEYPVVIRGAGDLATGVALRLVRAGFPVTMLELPAPLVVRRTVAFAEAVRRGDITVEGIRAERVESPEEALRHARDRVAVMVDPTGALLPNLRPAILIDARLAKRNIDTSIEQAEFVIGLGPGFTAGEDVHAVVETMRGHDLGRVLWKGSALPNTGTPGTVAGHAAERVLRAPVAGHVIAAHEIGEVAREGEPVATVTPLDPALDPVPILAPFTGLLRGLIAEEVEVPAGLKIGDLDPRLDTDVTTVSDKALAIGGGVLEAVLIWLNIVQAEQRPGAADAPGTE